MSKRLNPDAMGGSGAKRPRIVDAMSQTLDLHSSLPTQAAIISSRLEKINPLNSLTDSRFVQFRYSTGMNDLIHPAASFLYLKCKITGAAQEGAGAGKGEIIPANGIGGALFKNIIVKLNSTPIESGDGLYAYRADMEKRLLYPHQIQKHGMCLSMFDFPETSFDSYSTDKTYKPFGKPKKVVAVEAPDKAKEIDQTEQINAGGVEPPHASTLMVNVPTAFKNRVQYCSHGQEFEVVDTIHSDLFNQDRHLPPNSTIDLTFDLQDDPNFYLLSHAARGNRNLQIEQFQLWIRVDTVEPEVALDMQQETMQSPYRIPIRRVDMNYFTRTPSLTDLSETAALLKQRDRIPRRVFIGTVAQDAFHGKIDKDPFHYKDLAAENILLRVGGQQRPIFELRAKRSDTPTQDNITQFLFSLQLATGTLLSKYTTGINYFNWFEGNALIGFDLTSGDVEQVRERPATHPVELYYHLHKAIASSHVMIVYAEYDAEIQIDKNYEVSIVE